jgi:hypothetical protein
MPDFRSAESARPLVVACGALTRELRAVFAASDVSDVDVHYLPANLHNAPELIPGNVEPLIADAHRAGRQVFVAYADCGTGGLLDRVLERYPGVTRLPGAHCYEFLAGADTFAALHDTEPGSFYLTDFLARHFEALVWQGLGLDRHPELRDTYFRYYRRVVLLSQTDSDDVRRAATHAAARLDLPLHVVHTGLSPLRTIVDERLTTAVQVRT